MAKNFIVESALLAILPVCLLSVSCSTELRAPICRENEADLPDEINGYYQVTIPGSDIRLPGATYYRDVSLRLERTSSGLTLEAPSQTIEALRKAINNTYGLWGRGQSHYLSADLARMWKICSIAGEHFVEVENSNGTFSASSVQISDLNIRITPVSFDPERLKTQNVPFFMIPLADYGILAGPTPFPYPSSRPIVDNRFIDRGRLLAIKSMVPVSHVLMKIPEKKAPRDWARRAQRIHVTF